LLTTDLANKKAAIADSEERRPEMIKGTLIRKPLDNFDGIYFEVASFAPGKAVVRCTS
jgi:hypothetical protein